MATTFSTNLGIQLIGTGEQSGTWGLTTNTNLGTLIEQAISGYVTQAVATGTDTPITIPDGTDGVARNMYLELTGTGGASTNLIVPAKKKLYFIYNNTASGQVTVKVASQVGVSVPNGAKMVLVCNGTDIVSAVSYFSSLSLGSALPVTSGGTGQTSYTDGQLLIGNTTGNTLTKSTLTAGSGVTITNGAGSVTISATGSGGTVTAVTATSPVQSTGGTTPVISMPAATSTTNGYLTSTDWTTFNNKGSGTVTAVSVASANGFAGTSSGGATPALTLSTTVTGLLKGNGTAVSAAASGTDYAPATSGTSILYGNGSGGFSNVTVGSGLTFATGTLTATGSGGTVTSVDVSGGTTGLTTSGGPVTGSGTITLAGTLAATNGGTGQTSYAVGDLLYASTTTGLSKLADVATGNALISGGVGVAPSYGKIGLTTHVSGTLPVANGGTNATATPTAGAVSYGTGTAYAFNTAGTSGQALLSGGSGAPTFGTLGTGAGGTGLTSFTANGVVYASSTSALTTGSALTFDGTSLGVGTSASTGQIFINSASGNANQILWYNAGTVKFAMGRNVGAGGANDLAIYNYNNSTTPFTISSTSNIGIGVAPSAWGGIAGGVIQGYSYSLGTAAGGGTDTTSLATNAYYDGSNWIYRSSSSSCRYDQWTNLHRWYTAPSGTQGNAITYTESMRLDGSGNLGIGTTSSPAEKLEVASGKVLLSNTQSYAIKASSGATCDVVTLTSGDALQIGGGGATNNIQLWTGGVERARVDSSGNLLLGRTTNLSVTPRLAVENANFAVGINTTNGGTNEAIRFYNAGTTVGTISTDGSSTAYNTSSDYRLKNNPQPLTGSGAFIDALQPKTWEWTADGSRGVGFIAHEVQAVSPKTVVGEKDAVDEDGNPVMQAMSYSSPEFIANIIAELQSLRARVAELEKK
jgi:hypothetical protein